MSAISWKLVIYYLVECVPDANSSIFPETRKLTHCCMSPSQAVLGGPAHLYLLKSSSFYSLGLFLEWAVYFRELGLYFKFKWNYFAEGTQQKYVIWFRNQNGSNHETLQRSFRGHTWQLASSWEARFCHSRMGVLAKSMNFVLQLPLAHWLW